MGNDEKTKEVIKITVTSTKTAEEKINIKQMK